MDLTSFSHGQIKSKLWLCDKIHDFLPKEADAVILGSWYNVLGFMLFVRYPEIFKSCTAVDINMEAIEVATKISDYWYIEGRATTICANANHYEVPVMPSTVVINCSPEHFESDEWFHRLPKGTLVCIQSSNITDPKEPWLVSNPTPTYNNFVEKYKVADTMFSGTLNIGYSHFSYERYMVIGRK